MSSGFQKTNNKKFLHRIFTNGQVGAPLPPDGLGSRNSAKMRLGMGKILRRVLGHETQVRPKGPGSSKQVHRLLRLDHIALGQVSGS